MKVDLTEAQIWLIVEQMDKGAAAWESPRHCMMASRISHSLRLQVHSRRKSPPVSRGKRPQDSGAGKEGA